MSHPSAEARQTHPWNKGKLVGPKPPLKLKEVWAVRIRLQLAPSVPMFLRQIPDLQLV